MQKNNPYGFTGQRFEAETWMYSFAYRTYNPVSKRWLTPDPIRDGMNWYQYVSSDPVNLWDPLGLEVQINYYVTEITTNPAGGKTASGHMDVTNMDTEESFRVDDVKSGGLVWGELDDSNYYAPFGTYDILEHTHPDNPLIGYKLYHRLEAQDTNYGDDKVYFEDQDQAEREHLRLHFTGSGTTYGCVMVPNTCAEKILDELNNTRTSTVTVNSKSRNPFKRYEEQIKYGELHIIDARDVMKDD